MKALKVGIIKLTEKCLVFLLFPKRFPAMNIPPLGSPAPDFPLPPTPGRPAGRLSDLRGRPVLLAFSPPGWDPARAEGLAQINRIFAQSGFSGELLGLSQTSEGTEAVFSGEDEALPVLTAPLSGEAAALYGVPGRQALFVLDAQGTVRWQFAASPGAAPRAEDLLAALSSLAPAPPAPASFPNPRGLSRREFLAAALGVALVLSVPLGKAQAQAAPMTTSPALMPPSSVGTVPVTLHVNGASYALQIEPRVTLLDALRERIGLTGSKKGCDHGQCGACTVHAGGRRINSCLALAAAYQNKPITTIEGLANGDVLHPVQAAFIRHDGFQCGFCTSGQIMSATALLKEPTGPTDADVRESMSGNLCRCGAYTNIVAAIQEVRGQDVRKGENNAPV